jgi:alkylation response protein AidB-like acyl-CoA dehydrogenase
MPTGIWKPGAGITLDKARFLPYYTESNLNASWNTIKELLMSKEMEREMLQAAARKVAAKVLSSRAEEIDAQGEFPWDIVDLFGKQGFLSVLLPEAYGGMDGDITSFCLVIEEIAKVCGSSSLLVLVQGVGTMPILIAGNDEQKKKYFDRIASENKLVAFTLTEPEAGSDAASLRTKAEGQGDHYKLNGRKCFITNGGVADFYSTFVVTDPEKGEEGVSVIVIDKGTPGLSSGKEENKMGMRGSNTTDVVFEDCLVPRENLLGTEGQGWKTAMKTLNMSRPAVGAQAVGIAQGSLDLAIGYSDERHQFGRPISKFQGIRFMLADMATQIEAARSLVYRTAAIIDSKEGDSHRLSAMAKYFASDVAMKVTTDAVQILGGYGYMKDYKVERMMRDAKLTQIYEGTNQIQRMVVAHHLLAKVGEQSMI